MQYILTEEEFQELQNTNLKITQEAQKKLQEICTQAANEWPIKYWDRHEAGVWGCILTNDSEYCDECPMQEICPNENKEWSK